MMHTATALLLSKVALPGRHAPCFPQKEAYLNYKHVIPFQCSQSNTLKIPCGCFLESKLVIS